MNVITNGVTNIMSLFDKLDRTILRNIKVEHIVTKDKVFQDSITLGTPSRGGEIKVYGDYNNPEEFQRKINVALQLRETTNQRMYGSGSGELSK